MNPLQRIKSVSGFKLDLVANFAGTGWSAVMQLAFVPLYIKFMGIEAYGLVGFYLMLQAVLQVAGFRFEPDHEPRDGPLFGPAGESGRMPRPCAHAGGRQLVDCNC